VSLVVLCKLLILRRRVAGAPAVRHSQPAGKCPDGVLGLDNSSVLPVVLQRHQDRQVPADASGPQRRTASCVGGVRIGAMG
jgi:hypothetical protein